MARREALLSAALTGEVLAHGEITINAVTGSETVNQVLVNGVNQIGTGVSMTSGDEEASAIALRDAINSHTAGSGPNYTSHVTGAIVRLNAPPGTGKDANNHVISLSLAGTDMDYDVTRIYGGSDPSDIVDTVVGTRFFLDADYGAGSDPVSGEGEAAEDDISNAIEVTEYLVMRGLQAKLDVQDSTLSDDTLTIDRTMAIMTITVDTESGAGTDDLKTISTDGMVFGDILILQGANASHVVTVKSYTSGSDNIYLNGDTDFATGAKTRSICLQYVNDGGTAKFIERWRIPADTTISVAAMRSVSIPQPVNGTQHEALATGGGTLNLTPGTDKGYIILTGTGTLTGSWTVQGDGTPLDGETFIVDYRATLTRDGNNVTIFGISLTDTQALQGKCVVVATYDGVATAYRTRLYQDASATSWIKNNMIPDLEIDGGKLAAGTVPTSALIDPPATTYANERIPLQVSFELNEKGAYTASIAMAATLDKITYSVNKTVAGTDEGTINFQISGLAAITEFITIPASSALNYSGSITPSSNNIFTPTGANTDITITSAKTTAGGRVMIVLHLTRL
jgi:hypothetical protein